MKVSDTPLEGHVHLERSKVTHTELLYLYGVSKKQCLVLFSFSLKSFESKLIFLMQKSLWPGPFGFILLRYSVVCTVESLSFLCPFYTLICMYLEMVQG